MDCKLEINNTNSLTKGTNETGTKKINFSVVSGNRLLLSLHLASIDPGADIEVKVKHRFSGDVPFVEVPQWALNMNLAGDLSKCIAEFHNQFELEIVITGGNATYFIGASVFDDSGTTIRGRDGRYQADVVFEDGLYKLATDKRVQVESLAGVQQTASNWVSWEEVAEDDTFRVRIEPTDGTPLFDRTFTVLAGEDRFTFAQRVALELNQDFILFQPNFKATQVDDNSILFFESKVTAEAGENSDIDSFRVWGTGTLALTIYRNWNDWIRRTSTIQASKSTDDPRVGIFGVEGTVETRTADVSGLFVKQPFTNADPLQIEMAINPGGGGSVFTFPMDSLNDIFVSEIRFFGLDNGIQFTNFLGRNSALATGIEIEIKSDNNIVTFPMIKTTEDFADKFAFGGGDNFQLYIQSGADKFLAAFVSSAFPLRRAGTFGPGNDDYIKITINDNLSQVATLQSLVEGVIREA